MVNPIIKFGIPIVAIITVGLVLREAYATSLGSAGSSASGFGQGIGSAIEGFGQGIGSVPQNILGGFGSGLTSLSSGIKSFTSIFGIGNDPIPAVSSGATNPALTQRFSAYAETPNTMATTGSNAVTNSSLASPSSAVGIRQRLGF